MGEETIDTRNILRRAQIGAELPDSVWKCSTCRLCEESCPRDVDIVNVVLGLRELEFQDRKAPERIEKLVWDIYEDGNPWGGKKGDRNKWAEGLEIKDASKGVETLLFVGCDGAYNKELHKSLRSLAEILKKSGTDFGFLGNEESCCGEPVRDAGETGYLDELVEKNILQFESTKARTLVTFSPHCSNMFSTIYKKKGLKMKVMHYSEYLNELVRDGKITINSEIKKKITIHDPCYLSRYGGDSKELRELVVKVPGTEIVEMENSGKNSLCCGGGGDRIFMDFEGKRLSDFRMEQAKNTGAEVVITACPICNMNLSDSRKVNGIKMEIMELSEFLKGGTE